MKTTCSKEAKTKSNALRISTTLDFSAAEPEISTSKVHGPVHVASDSNQQEKLSMGGRNHTRSDHYLMLLRANPQKCQIVLKEEKTLSNDLAIRILHQGQKNVT